MLVRDRFGHQHRLSDYIDPSIPIGLISHKDSRMPPGVSVRKELQCRASGFVQSIQPAEALIHWRSPSARFGFDERRPHPERWRAFRQPRIV